MYVAVMLRTQRVAERAWRGEGVGDMGYKIYKPPIQNPGPKHPRRASALRPRVSNLDTTTGTPIQHRQGRGGVRHHPWHPMPPAQAKKSCTSECLLSRWRWFIHPSIPL